MNATTTTVRQVLRVIRSDVARLKTEGTSYLSGHLEYPCDKGTLRIRNAPASERGSVLLGLFIAELVSPRGETVKTYKV